MSEYILTPKVDSTQEFIEIAFDFSNPLDLVREAISNSFDAKATEMTIAFDVETVRNKRVLKGFHGVYLLCVWDYYSAECAGNLFLIDRICIEAIKLIVQKPLTLL